MRSLSIFALLVASSSLASATVISSFCTPTGPSSGIIGTFANGAGANSFSCGGFTAPANFQITAITLTGQADYQFGGNGANTFQVSFAVPAGFSPSPLIATAIGGSSSPAITQFVSNLGSGLPVASYAAFAVGATGTTPAGSVASGSGVLQVAYTYEAIPQTGGVPEPSTLALVGGVLVLAGIRKFRS